MSRKILILLVLILFACAGEQEMILLPSGFTGVVHIVFNRKSGLAPEYESGRRIYRIPDNGILCTKFPPNEGIRIAHTILYQVQGKERVPIEKFSVKEYQSEIGKTMIPNSESGEIIFVRFLVAKQHEADRFIQLKDSLDVTKICR